jgi:hypothetical protein
VPALIGQVVSTITDGTGQPVFVVYENFDPAQGNTLIDKAVQTLTGTKTGALVVDNMTGRTQSVTCSDGSVVKTFSIPAGGAVLTAAQLAANRANNGGPITTLADLAGISPTLT